MLAPSALLAAPVCGAQAGPAAHASPLQVVYAIPQQFLAQYPAEWPQVRQEAWQLGVCPEVGGARRDAGFRGKVLIQTMRGTLTLTSLCVQWVAAGSNGVRHWWERYMQWCECPLCPLQQPVAAPLASAAALAPPAPVV